MVLRSALFPCQARCFPTCARLRPADRDIPSLNKISLPALPPSLPPSYWIWPHSRAVGAKYIKNSREEQTELRAVRPTPTTRSTLISSVESLSITAGWKVCLHNFSPPEYWEEKYRELQIVYDLSEVIKWGRGIVSKTVLFIWKCKVSDPDIELIDIILVRRCQSVWPGLAWDQT